MEKEEGGGGEVNNESARGTLISLDLPLMFYLLYLLNVSSGKQWSREGKRGRFFS